MSRFANRWSRFRLLRRSPDIGVRRARLGVRELLTETLAGVMARPGRTVLTVLGTVLGVAALVATLGISKTAGNQIVQSFDALEATGVVVQPVVADVNGKQVAKVNLPWDVESRLQLNGVRSAGALAEVKVAGGAVVRRSQVRDPSGANEASLRTVAVSPGLLDAVRGKVLQGRWFDIGNVERGDRVVVLGAEAARRLGITRLDQRPAIFIGDEVFTVIGIIGDLAREKDLENSVLLPSGIAAERFGAGAPTKVVIDTELGAAQLIASQAPIALAPNDPAGVRVGAPPSLSRARSGVETEVNSLFLILGLVTLVVGAIGIANVTLVTVLERVGEIGLRRALGAARRHIAYQFLMESAAMGLLGGIVGASLGIGVITAVSMSRQWTPVLDASIPLGAPVLGTVIGLLAGIYPALRAASMEPVEALRSGM